MSTCPSTPSPQLPSPPIAYMIENQYAWDFAEKMICEAVNAAEADGSQRFQVFVTLVFWITGKFRQLADAIVPHCHAVK